ncbi:Hypothetical_protein [Hexamita inflata]|uniref:Hypothetical_protein n=1 Tax=Hexamita inflata TaxID=28002 RepID=A0ABP1GUW1_9EUKA
MNLKQVHQRLNSIKYTNTQVNFDPSALQSKQQVTHVQNHHLPTLMSEQRVISRILKPHKQTPSDQIRCRSPPTKIKTLLQRVEQSHIILAPPQIQIPFAIDTSACIDFKLINSLKGSHNVNYLNQTSNQFKGITNPGITVYEELELNELTKAFTEEKKFKNIYEELNQMEEIQIEDELDI